jgi:hypothetical protein
LTFPGVFPAASVWVRLGDLCPSGWPPGVFTSPPAYGLGLVVLRRLPRQRATLLVRLLGRGAVLRDALEDLACLPHDALERSIASRVLIALRRKMEQDARAKGKLSREEREFLMNTQELYEQWRNELEDAARRRGRDEGLQQGLLAAHAARFGTTPPELVAAIEGTHDEETLRRWYLLIITAGSGAEIAAGLLAHPTPSRPRG